MSMLKRLPLRTIVADDHRLFRQGLVGLLGTRPDLVTVIGQASSGGQAVNLARQLRPDLVLMDISMPDGDGLTASRVLRRDLPEAAVVMLTASELDEHLYEAVRLGAAGYLLKSLDAEELFELLGAVAVGEAALTRAMAARLLKNVAWHAGQHGGPEQVSHEALTERELEVLRLVARGLSNPEIAAELCITVNTVKVHLRNILDKLQLANRTQAAAYALQTGLAPAGAAGR
jgi:DNA-binding NarL/FixJ family response regulator